MRLALLGCWLLAAPLIIPAAPASSASPPSAAQILASAATYASLRGSAHITLRGRVFDGSESAVIRGFEDQSQRSSELHSVQTDSGNIQAGGQWTTGSLRSATIGVGASGAVRAGKSGWVCASLDTSAYSIVPAIDSSHLSRPVPLILGGMPGWKIVARARSGRVSFQETFYVASLGRLVRSIFIAVQPGSAASGPRQQIYLVKNYSRWGEAIHLSLPPACRHQAAP